MKKLGAVLIAGGMMFSAGACYGASKVDGKKEFQEHCAVCHKDGGNIINPQKTLKGADRDANGIKSAKDIVKLMRNPGPGMNKFDKKTISDKEAKAIAEYILKTY